MKVVVGLGNPGPEYEDTRHNVGWWILDRLAHDWELGPFERKGRALACEGVVGSHRVRLMKPTTYMNRSGAAVISLRMDPDFDVARDLLVAVDDASLEVGRIRFRGSGGTGGHNGLRSIRDTLGTDGYARVRVGVGLNPPGMDLADWVLGPFTADEEDAVLAVLPDVVAGVRVWMDEGVDAAMNRFNR